VGRVFSSKSAKKIIICFFRPSHANYKNLDNSITNDQRTDLVIFYFFFILLITPKKAKVTESETTILHKYIK